MIEISKDKSTNSFAVLSQTKSHIAQKVAITTPLVADLAFNPHLDPALWDDVRKVADPDSDYEAYRALLKTVPDSSRADEVLQWTNNTYMLGMMLCKCVEKVSQRAVDEIVALPTFDMLLAAPLIACGRLPEQMVLPQVQYMVDRQRESSLALTPLHVTFDNLFEGAVSKYKVISDEFATEILLDSRTFHINARRIIDHRPRLITPLLAGIIDLQRNDPKKYFRLRTHQSALLGVALSQHVTPAEVRTLLKVLNSPTMLKCEVPAALSIISYLLLNPSVSSSSKKKAVARSEDLLPYLRKEDAHRFANLTKGVDAAKLELQANLPRIRTTWDKVPPSDRKRVSTAVRTFGTWSYPTLYPTYPSALEIQEYIPELPLSKNYVNATLSPLLDAAGATAWEIFLATLPTWHGDVQDLALISASTATNR